MTQTLISIILLISSVFASLLDLVLICVAWILNQLPNPAVFIQKLQPMNTLVKNKIGLEINSFQLPLQHEQRLIDLINLFDIFELI